ncbi:MAG: dephospho-CoA kinase [Clostridia bacterium]|nr:dephospho-CoA kinase [Clostridia bacterium]
MIIGVYGRIGSGKTTFCNYLRTKGFYVINGDKISREILMPGKLGLSQVIDAFGTQFLNADGTLNRKKLGDYVFSNPDGLQLLNAITHPLITAKVKEQIDAHPRQHIVIEGAVLYATDILKFCQKTVVTTSDVALKRIMARDLLTEEEAKNRINAQEIYEQADFIIENNGTLPEFYQKIDRMLENIL